MNDYLWPASGLERISLIKLILGREAYFVEDRISAIEDLELRSSLRIEDEARVKPVLITSQSFLWKALTTCRPRRPVAPVMRTFWVMVI